MSILPGCRHEPSVTYELWDPFHHDSFHFPSPRPLVAPHPPFAHETTHVTSAKIDWKETPDAHVFKVDIPGLRKDEVKVEVEDSNMLCISGERKIEKEEKGDKWHRVECSRGMFLRSFRLPENARADKMRASMENGVLTVTIPKMEFKKHSRTIHVH